MEKKKVASMDLSTFQKSGFKDLDTFRSSVIVRLPLWKDEASNCQN